MKKNRIRLTESDLHNIIKESVKRVLNEEGYAEIKKIYYPLMDNIESFIDCLYDEGYAGDGCVEGNKLVEKLKSTSDNIFDFFLHPEGTNGKRVWDALGY